MDNVYNVVKVNMRLAVRVALLLGVLLAEPAMGVDQCPIGCECYPSSTKMKCFGTYWSDFNEKNSIVFQAFPQLQQLDFSNNKIIGLESLFLSLPALKKLNLSDNRIKWIAPGAFSNLIGLTTLDLSGNMLSNISRVVLEPLKSLERLKIRSNQLTTLEVNVFGDLRRLKALDISDNPWHCDCALGWISAWITSSSVKMQPPPKCATPATSIGVSLKRLDLQCLAISGLELTPSQDQVVFAGDSLALRCRAVGVADRVQWVWRDEDPKTHFTEVVIAERTLPEHGLVESLVRIERLEPQHSGDWVCQQVSGGNHSATVSVLVLSETTQYCPGTITKDNKGVYFWPPTVVGNDVELPCAEERVGSILGMATYTCNDDGQWEDVNTSACPYVSETTKILEQFARDDLTKARDPIVQKAKRLLNITSAVESLADPVDLIFVSQAVEMYTDHLASSADLAPLLVDIISGMLRFSTKLLKTAEVSGQACSRLRSSLHHVALETPAFQAHSALLAVEEFSVVPDSFIGMTCVWRQMHSLRQFHCSTSERTLLDVSSRDTVAIVELPASLFMGLESKSRHLVVSMFSNGNLFPEANDVDDASRELSAVVGVNIDELVGVNLTEPIAVMVRVEPGVQVEPVRWENDGWSHDGCQFSQTTRDIVLFHCHRLSYFALRLQYGSFARWGRTLLGQGALYSGSFVLLVCLCVTLITYVTCHSAVQMSRRAKHAVTNTWLSIFLLCFLFSFGAFATDDAKMCEVLGLAMHYFTLSTLLWMVVTCNHMYKRVSRGTGERPADDLPPDAPLHKPILGLYLVGWGIGLIVCGISGAVHLRDYAQPAFCFLGTGPALSALFVPTAILIAVLAVLFFLSLCAIRNNNDVNGQLSEGTQGTEHVDLELLEDGACAGTDRRSARSDLTDSEEIEDPEHTPLIQLKAHVIVLFLFLFLWTTAAMATTSSIYTIIPYQEPVATCLYCLSAVCLGAFILYFYCVARSDVRDRWGAFCLLLGTRSCCRPRSVSDTHASLPLQAAPPQLPPNRPASVNSGLTGRSSSSHRTKAVSELNNCDASDPTYKPTHSVNLVAMHRQIYRSNNSMPTYQEISSQHCADAFYNPRQSIVAKKFFKKQRRNRRNELGLRRRGDGGGTSEGEASARRTWRPSAESAVFLSSDMENNSEKLAPHLLPYGSKINNTNIHVGHSSRRKETSSPKNPNVLSEDEEDKGSEKLLLARLVIGAEEETSDTPGLARLDEESTEPAPDCRSVELQCSLGESSDVPEGDDSFCQRIDSLQLTSDESCVERQTSPPQYVTVLDPKYGVVKVTMNDFHQQFHRLSLASSPGDYASDVPTHLTSTPEEELEPEEQISSEQVLENNSDLIYNGSHSPTCSLDRNKPPRTLHISKNYPRTHKHSHRRSLPASPESRDLQERQQHSLPASPRLTIPPPPALPVPDQDDASEQWQRPEPPTSPSSHRDERRRPFSDNLLDRRDRLKHHRLSLSSSPIDSPQEEVKKETSV